MYATIRVCILRDRSTVNPDASMARSDPEGVGVRVADQAWYLQRHPRDGTLYAHVHAGQ